MFSHDATHKIPLSVVLQAAATLFFLSFLFRLYQIKFVCIVVAVSDPVHIVKTVLDLCELLTVFWNLV